MCYTNETWQCILLYYIYYIIGFLIIKKQIIKKNSFYTDVIRKLWREYEDKRLQVKEY